MKLVIAGSGKMGHDLFNLMLGHDFKIVWLCIDETEADRAGKSFEKRLGRQLRAGLIDQKAHDGLRNGVLITSDQTMAAGAEMVLEAVFEDADTKADFFNTISGIVNPDALLATNTSSIPLRRIFRDDQLLKRAAGLHFFYPAQLRDLVEVNLNDRLATEMIRKIDDLMQRIGRFHINLPEKENFLLNRLLLPVQLEAVLILNEGLAEVREIDALTRNALFPIGIFEFFDHVGQDIMSASVRNYSATGSNEEVYAPLQSHLDGRVSAGDLGMKAGKGYYQYPVAPDHFSMDGMDTGKQQDIIQRLELAFFGELGRCLDKETLPTADLDRALKEYWGVENSFIELGRERAYLK
jgi:3-hydroxybutyryl-CoA dehydrogenase